MKLGMISVITLFICTYEVIGGTLYSESARKLLESSYQSTQTEDAFVTYVTFLINRGEEECNQSWLDEADRMIKKHEWSSYDQRLKVSRNLCLKRAGFMAIEERYEYLAKASQLYPVDYRDSLTVLLEVTEEQRNNILEGHDTPAAIFTRETSAYIKAEIENKLGYLEVMLQHGRSVYYVDEVFLTKAGDIIEGLQGTPLQDSDLMRYLSIKIKLSTLSGDFDGAVKSLRQLGTMKASEGYNPVLSELHRWIVLELKPAGRKDVLPVDNVIEDVERIILDQEIKGSNKGTRPPKSSF